MARGRSLAEFQKAFADEASCATFLFKRRWPDGFVCPAAASAAPMRLKLVHACLNVWIADARPRSPPAP